MATLRMGRCVIVQPSVYGSDHACLLDAPERLGPETTRGVAVVDPGASDAELRRLHGAGIRGARLNLVSGGGPAVPAMRTLARRIAPLGWHLALFLPREMRVEFAPSLIELPVKVVIDHLGDVDPELGEDNPTFAALRRLVPSGQVWIKLTGYRLSRLPAPFPDLAPYVRKLAAIRPEALPWGSNWPHPIRYSVMPDKGDLLDALRTWIPGTVPLKRILVSHPADPYDLTAPRQGHLMLRTEPPELTRANGGAGECGQGKVWIGAALVAGSQAVEPDKPSQIKPNNGTLDHPARRPGQAPLPMPHRAMREMTPRVQHSRRQQRWS